MAWHGEGGRAGVGFETFVFGGFEAAGDGGGGLLLSDLLGGYGSGIGNL